MVTGRKVTSMSKYHGSKPTVENDQKWSDLLARAVSEPGLILKAYSAFHGYSIGNQLAAMIQCGMRGIEPGPIDTYPGWKSKGRQVRKGEKAILLCMPLTRKRKTEDDEDEIYVSCFVWKPHWFVMSQTSGEPVAMPEIPEWSKERALSNLGIIEISFDLTDGNTQGYARGREIAISPVAALPYKTLLHELAHVELGHTLENGFTDSEITPRNLREAEAEAVAMIALESLGLDGTAYCRGYIQNWLSGDVIPEKSAMKIFGAADRILKAGRA